ncbi:hypothetical protein F4801DRAFT_588343 [Xylaria longipes]|nr:hypothetical protein F4801DRAFT_588343 [Xylaria longipes]
MAPNYRQNTQTRRGNRSGYVEHDDFEGLPIRIWRPDWVNMTPPPPPDPTRKNDIWAMELPHGMPKDSQLLPTHSQELLRAVRSGRLWKPSAPAEEEEAEADPAVAEKTEKKEEDPSAKGFQVRIWKQLARNAEWPTVSHLAKRRKGTITLSSDLPAGAAPGPTITRATVRRIDAAGSAYTQEVILNEGQSVDGEIISTTVVAVPVPSLNGDASVTPVRRRPPPPKRKPKGPGRGRKKKLPLPVSAHTNAANPAAARLASGVQVDGTQGIKLEDNESKQNDIEMADDDEGDDGDDGEDDGEEGDEDDEEGEGADGEASFVSRADSETKSDQMDINPSQNETGEIAGTTHLQSSQELPSANTKLSTPLPPPSHIEGSPLKQVISAQSPRGLDPDSASQGSTTNPSATLDSIEQTLHPAESEPGPLPIMDESTVPETSGANTMPTAGKDATDNLDVEMQDVVPSFMDTSTENIPLAPADNSTEIADVQNSSLAEPIEPSDPAPTALPVDEETMFEAIGTEPSPKSAEIGEASVNSTGEVQISENATETATEADASAEPSARDTTDSLIEPSTVQATDSSSTDEQHVSAPGLTESQDDQPVPQTQEENAANSPDLFSGLEAALNQHGHSSSSEPIPDKPETSVSQPEVSFQSE